ncbi:serine hydrolase domain-containing protein [Chitinophaga polysaccharea]|uniref:serine hydrolase domain-containing protein n=1 Tax=Chitinophaga polysaccharea TaxID=1293035 RepID=UPI00115B981F|nr:serine hydrolase domain-containing protein [Chitinophaga polysaccharea]
MKIIFAVLSGLFLYNALQAQSVLQDSLVARYNRNDFSGVYNLGSASWRSNTNPDGIAGWLQYMKSQTGPIMHSALTTDSGKAQFFKWDGAKKMLSFKLILSDTGGFEGFDFQPYHLPLSMAYAAPVSNDNPLKTHLDSAVHYSTTDFMLTHHLIGLSVGVVNNGHKHFYNYGTVEKDKMQLPTSQTVFELASIAKTFTGILLAQAVLDHKISLDDDIRKFMPGDFPNLQYQGAPLKIVNLANHTSGLPVELPNLDTFKNEFDVMKMYDHYTNDKFFTDLRSVKIDTLPGVRYGYSNAGMKLLGIVLEKAYGLSYQQLLKKYITGLLDMPATRTGLLISDTTSYTKGYSGDGITMPHGNWNMFGGAAAIISNSHDMANYVKANIDESQPAIRLSHKQTFTDGNFTLGLGWQISRNTINGTRIWKSGGALGFRSYCAVVPDKKIGMIWLSNRSDLADDEIAEMVDQILLAAKQ